MERPLKLVLPAISALALTAAFAGWKLANAPASGHVASHGEDASEGSHAEGHGAGHGESDDASVEPPGDHADAPKQAESSFLGPITVPGDRDAQGGDPPHHDAPSHDLGQSNHGSHAVANQHEPSHQDPAQHEPPQHEPAADHAPDHHSKNHPGASHSSSGDASSSHDAALFDPGTAIAPFPEGNAPSHALSHRDDAAFHEVDYHNAAADAALTMLIEGNARWASGSMADPHVDVARRELLAAEGQTPQASVLTCADSRIPVERAFDVGVGDVFVVRVAGNVAAESEVGSIEYGVGHLHTPLLVVMGHSKCGAVSAALSGAELHGSVAGLVAAVAPAVERARKQNPGLADAELLPFAVRENVWQQIYDLFRESPECRSLAASGNLKVVGAVYDIATGEVEFMGEHPWQAELLAALEAQDAGHANAGGQAEH